MTKDDAEVDPDVNEAWRQEISRRTSEIDSGAVKPVPWAEAKKQLRSLLADAEQI